MTNENREKHYTLTLERAKEIYEIILRTTDFNAWEVFVDSRQDRMLLSEFKEYAHTRMNHLDQGNPYNPSMVAKDCLMILDAQAGVFDNLGRQLENAFKGILVVNEDMGNNIEQFETEIEDNKQTITELEEQISHQAEEIELLQTQLQEKHDLIEPLRDIIEIRTEEIIKLYDDFKSAIGDDIKMKSFKDIFKKEIDCTKQLIRFKLKQILESSLDLKGNKKKEIENSEYESDISEEDTQGQEEEIYVPKQYGAYRELYIKAVKQLRPKEAMYKKANIYEAEVQSLMNRLINGGDT